MAFGSRGRWFMLGTQVPGKRPMKVPLTHRAAVVAAVPTTNIKYEYSQYDC